MTATLEFTLAPELEAHEPPEARGLARDEVRLLVGSADGVRHHRFTDLPSLLRAGDVLVVNTSATMASAVDTVDKDFVVHFSTRQPDGRWVVEVRRPVDGSTQPFFGGRGGQRLTLSGGVVVTLAEAYSDRLWIAEVSVDSVPRYLRAHGRPIRYSYVERDWPLWAYRSVFAISTPDDREGSAEMPSASRPFTEALVTRLASRGVVIAPITLHTGVASPEAHERPYPERFEVPETTARLVTQARAAGGRIIAVGTTAVRALETAARADGSVQAAAGWTDLVVTPDRGVRVIDGLLTGFHEPRASHLLMLSAIVGADLLSTCYREAVEHGYLWHEFGDLNLLLR
ncbi:S-adenosylmethionine:tRNA ribosyltransferase-isomerase [Hamadaea sp. NPDC050747]|uniref:S-adenosylmethionine:tRNA ribosyltransferase-isomerase n=1 Tax=Hamadaea sp. NPDC050747 TaxID=3155789 RepID=UPI0033FC4AC4